MADTRYVTLAIHTYNYALALQNVLQQHGIGVRLDKVGIAGSKIASGVRVRIADSDLPLALKIIESGDLSAFSAERKLTGVSNQLLIPVDFSEMSMLAVRAGFEFALRLQLHPLILFAAATPYFDGDFAYSDEVNRMQAEEEDILEASELIKEADKRMTAFAAEISRQQKESELPDCKFSTLVLEGVAEEVILNYTRQTPPALVVMATRGRNKRNRELVGSVTGEVLDSCRTPVFTVPENYSFCGIRQITRLAVFCNLDQQDLISMDYLMRMFGYPEVDLWLIPVNERAGESAKTKVEDMAEYFSGNYKTARFHTAVFGATSFRTDFESLTASERLQMIIVPNKKKNIFARLFNPGIAHKLLFEKDIPMLALPV